MKIVVTEFDRKILGIDIILYFIFLVIGVVLLKLTEVTQIDTIKYISSIFFTLGFFSLLTYFANRVKGDYEFLGFGIINVVVGAFIMYNQFNGNNGFILSDAMMIYTISNLLNKCYCCYNLSKEKNVIFFFKISVTIIITMIGMLASFELFYKEGVSDIIFSYFFITYGLLSLLEPLMVIVMRNPKVKNKTLSILKYEDNSSKNEKNETKKANKKLPTIKNKKINEKAKNKKIDK